MKKTLNDILYKLAENELNNSVINEQSGEVWKRIKDKFKRDKYDYTPVDHHASETEPGETIRTGDENDVVNINTYSFRLSPPMASAGINSPYGKWRGTRRHKGVDMRTPAGTPVYAIRPGSVIAVASNPKGWGDYIITKHDPLTTRSGEIIGETFYALYAHLSDVRVSVNDEITFGQVIGLSGGVAGAPGSGNSQGPHLHFEIKTKQSHGEIDPVKFYAKYNQRLEHAPILKNFDEYENDLSKNKQADYIVNPGQETKTLSAITTDITADVKDKIIPGETELDGFYVYELPDDDTYLYGVPSPKRSDLTYGWWFTNSYDKNPMWKYLKSVLTPSNYNIAVVKLNDLYPTAIDQIKLVDIEMQQRSQDNTRQNQNNNKPKSDATALSIYSKLKKNEIYTAASILKSNKFSLYSYDNNTKKFTLEYAATANDDDRIQYIGHDSKNKYMFIRILSTSFDPAASQSWWVDINDIKLSNKKKF